MQKEIENLAARLRTQPISAARKSAPKMIELLDGIVSCLEGYASDAVAGNFEVATWRQWAEEFATWLAGDHTPAQWRDGWINFWEAIDSFKLPELPEPPKPPAGGYVCGFKIPRPITPAEKAAMDRRYAEFMASPAGAYFRHIWRNFPD